MPAAATLPPLIRKLLDPARTPLPGPGPVTLIETHISWVLLAGEFVWKFKKPITLAFLDYGTPERRRACCEAELRLNRRLAPRLYLDVVEFDGEPAVRMRRFDEAARLDHVCKRGALTTAHLSGLAATLAAFHAAAAVAPAPTTRRRKPASSFVAEPDLLDAAGGTFFGTPARVQEAALENFTELRALTRGRLDPELDQLEAWTRAEFARRETAFAARRTGGFVRECLGDLHLGNMVLLDETVVPFDGIEFNDDFRWIDVASEIAFVLVDLLDNDRSDLAGWLLNEWLVATGDFGALPLLRFYMIYRALVRAKVAAIRARQQATGPAECAEVRGYLALAQRIAVPPEPTFFITHGLAGCGKTTLSTARLLADPLAATVRLRSDVERKRLFGLAASAASGSPLDAGIYTLEANARTYARLAELADAALAAGWSVIVDAAFLKRAERDAFRALAARHGVVMQILAPRVADAELERRVEARRGSGDASEAGREVLERQRGYLEPLGNDEPALTA